MQYMKSSPIGEYIGVSSKAHKIKEMYIGVNGKARKIKKAYIGVGGKARLAYASPTSNLVVKTASGTANFTMTSDSGYSYQVGVGYLPVANVHKILAMHFTGPGTFYNGATITGNEGWYVDYASGTSGFTNYNTSGTVDPEQFITDSPNTRSAFGMSVDYGLTIESSRIKIVYTSQPIKTMSSYNGTAYASSYYDTWTNNYSIYYI